MTTHEILDRLYSDPKELPASEDNSNAKLSRDRAFDIWNDNTITKEFLLYVDTVIDRCQNIVEQATNPEQAYIFGKHIALLKRIKYYARRGTSKNGE